MFSINFIVSAILFMPTVLAASQTGQCFFGGAFNAGSCHFIGTGGVFTGTWSDCPTSSPCNNNNNFCQMDTLNGVTTCS
ncbi:hypothetical protein Trisim1_005195 [Trichoderma cf. simile WF8]